MSKPAKIWTDREVLHELADLRNKIQRLKAHTSHGSPVMVDLRQVDKLLSKMILVVQEGKRGD